jgi:hypothetical protein
VTIAEAPARRAKDNDVAFSWSDFLVPNTGHEFDEALESFSTQLVATELSPQPTIASADQLRAANRLSQPMARRRTTSLLVLLAHMGGASFGEAAELIGTSERQLTRYVHADVSFPDSMFKRVLLIDEVLRYVHRVLDPVVTGDWLRTPIPALDSKTPSELIRRRRFERLLEHVKQYPRPIEFT